MPALMKRYSDLPMDLADASLVLLAESLGHGRILTTDERDFRTYRWEVACAFRKPARRALKFFTNMKQRLGHPATRAVAPGKRRDPVFVELGPALAACGGGHIPVPGVARVEFHGSGSAPSRWGTS
jgi:hypothetical protein